jgi:AcrR family transcriptional regulator
METKRYYKGFQGFRVQAGRDSNDFIGGNGMDEAIQSRIVQAAAELFNAKGYRNVTLSELAARLGMSKKTLYLYFSGKEEIAEAVLDQTMQAIAVKIANVTNREGNPIQIFQETFLAIKHEIMKLNPLFLDDVQKYIPNLWGKVEDFRGHQLTFIEGLLTKAQQAGLIREVNPHLMTVIMMESIQHFVRPDFAAKHGFSIIDIANTLFMLFVESIRTEREP